MFNLEQAVEAWTLSVEGRICSNDDKREELIDHIYTEIEALQAQGLDAEAAFMTATEQLGSAESLQQEYAKNQSLFSKVISAEKTLLDANAKESNVSPKIAGQRIILISLLFAAAMIATPLLITDERTANLIIFAVLLPLWAAIYFSMPGMRHAASCEVAYLKRVVSKVRLR